MAKQIEFTGKKLSKKVMDEKILRYLELNEQSKIIKKEIDALKKELEGQYTLPADQKEEFFGKETQMEKIPVDNGKNVYDRRQLVCYQEYKRCYGICRSRFKARSAYRRRSLCNGYRKKSCFY